MESLLSDATEGQQLTITFFNSVYNKVIIIIIIIIIIITRLVKKSMPLFLSFLECCPYMLFNTYILLDVLMCTIAEYFYELCRILPSPKGDSKYKRKRFNGAESNLYIFNEYHNWSEINQ